MFINVLLTLVIIVCLFILVVLVKLLPSVAFLVVLAGFSWMVYMFISDVRGGK